MRRALLAFALVVLAGCGQRCRLDPRERGSRLDVDTSHRANRGQPDGRCGVARPCPGRGFLRDSAPLVDLRLPLRLSRRPGTCGWCAPAGGRHQVPDRQSTRPQLHLHDPRSFRLPLPGRHGCDCSRLRACDPTLPRSGCSDGRAECAARPCRRCRAREHPLDHDGQAGPGPADGALLDAVLRDSGRPSSNSGPDGPDGRPVLHRKLFTERDRPQAKPELRWQPSAERSGDRLVFQIQADAIALRVERGDADYGIISPPRPCPSPPSMASTSPGSSSRPATRPSVWP